MTIYLPSLSYLLNILYLAYNLFYYATYYFTNLGDYI